MLAVIQTMTSMVVPQRSMDYIWMYRKMNGGILRRRKMRFTLVTFVQWAKFSAKLSLAILAVCLMIAATR